MATLPPATFVSLHGRRAACSAILPLAHEAASLQITVLQHRKCTLNQVSITPNSVKGRSAGCDQTEEGLPSYKRHSRRQSECMMLELYAGVPAAALGRLHTKEAVRAEKL